MRTLKINGKTLTVYDSIDEMPILNFQKFNKYLLIDSGIGSDADAVGKHISMIANLIRTDPKKAVQELTNMGQNLMMIVSEISPKNLAFAALIQSVNDKEVTDLSDENLKNLLTEINKAKHSWLIDMVYQIKKKITEELELYFPENFQRSKEKEAYDKLKARTLLLLESVTDDKDNADEISRIDEYLLSLHKPLSFIGESSVEIKYDKQFESMCFLISQKAHMDAKSMNVLQFYNTLALIKAQAEAEAKACKNPVKRR